MNINSLAVLTKARVLRLQRADHWEGANRNGEGSCGLIFIFFSLFCSRLERSALKIVSGKKVVMIGPGRYLNWLYTGMLWRLRVLHVEGWSWRYAAPCCAHPKPGKNLPVASGWCVGFRPATQIHQHIVCGICWTSHQTMHITIISEHTIEGQSQKGSCHAFRQSGQRSMFHFASRFDTDSQ